MDGFIPFFLRELFFPEPEEEKKQSFHSVQNLINNQYLYAFLIK